MKKRRIFYKKFYILMLIIKYSFVNNNNIKEYSNEFQQYIKSFVSFIGFSIIQFI